MLIREVNVNDLDSLQKLYLHLHENKLTPLSNELSNIWRNIIEDENYHILVGEDNGKLISSVTLVIILNLTRQAKPYAIIENVITHADYRSRGYGKMLIQEAIKIAEESGCYKIMLLTGSKEEVILKFYESCGFNCKDKTAFIKWL